MDPKEPCTCERETQDTSQDLVQRYFKIGKNDLGSKTFSVHARQHHDRQYTVLEKTFPILKPFPTLERWRSVK